MFKRRKPQFDYNECLMSINREIRNKNLQKYDTANSDKLGVCSLTYNLNDMNKLLHLTTSSTKELLVEKGFTTSLEDRVEKSVLLNTEISELADAVKKGYGVDAEGSEIADIIIRASNFLCLNETFHQYLKLSYAISNNLKSHDTVSVTISNNKNLDEKQRKYSLIEHMMTSWIEIKKASEMVEICCQEKLGEERFVSSFIVLWNKIIDLSAYCSAYVTLYLPKNLQYYVTKKMNENFKRPYRYGTSEEVK